LPLFPEVETPGYLPLPLRGIKTVQLQKAAVGSLPGLPIGRKLIERTTERVGAARRRRPDERPPHRVDDAGLPVESAVADGLCELPPCGPADHEQPHRVGSEGAEHRIKGSEKFWSESGGESVLQLKADELSSSEPLKSFWTGRPKTRTGLRARCRKPTPA